MAGNDKRCACRSDTDELAEAERLEMQQEAAQRSGEGAKKERHKFVPGKLLRELRLFKAIYDDEEIRRDERLDETDRQGIPYSHLKTIIPYNAKNPDVFRRTLRRYLLELEAAGVIMNWTIERETPKGWHCHAETCADGLPSIPESERGQHETMRLQKLERIVRLMCLYMSNRASADGNDDMYTVDREEALENHRYSALIFRSKRAQVYWYEAEMVTIVSQRTMQEEAKMAVLTAEFDNGGK